VVDNFEHVLDAAELIAELDRQCLDLRFLITSREPLNLASEHRFRVSPLAVAARSASVTPSQIEAAPAGALFVAAARRRNDRFEVSRAAAPAIAEICSRLDGLPLALELAAERITVLSVSELAERLDDAVTDLGSGPRDAPRGNGRWSPRSSGATECSIRHCSAPSFASRCLRGARRLTPPRP
jgi:non-specific serine/threonine protein kinase